MMDTSNGLKVDLINEPLNQLLQDERRGNDDVFEYEFLDIHGEKYYKSDLVCMMMSKTN
jgi:hypothetical protein